MNSKIFLLLIFWALPVALPAQGPKLSPQERAKWETNRMTQELALDSVQADSVYAINLRFSLKMEDLRKESEENRHEQFGKLREARDEEMKGVLTEEQFKKYQEMMKRPMGPKGGKHPGEQGQ